MTRTNHTPRLAEARPGACEQRRSKESDDAHPGMFDPCIIHALSSLARIELPRILSLRRWVNKD